jgi:uncharacterized membrane protein YgcG
MSGPGAIPLGARLLHVGPPKTGSTALQDALHQSRPALRRQGVTYVSRGRHELIPARYATGRLPSGPKWAWAERRWHELVAALREEGPERKIYSSEYLADATDDQVARIVDAVGPEDLYVVITLRPLVDIVPSQYQQYLQGGLTEDYESWLEVTFNHPPYTGPTPWFWQRHRHDALVQRWVRAIGAERVIVVVTDGRDFDAVPTVFEQLLELSPGTLTGRKVRQNRSLTWAEAEVMRRFNVQAHEAGIVDSKYQFLTKFAADHVKERVPRPGEGRIVTPDWAAKQADELGADFVAAIEESGVRVIGDLRQLCPGPLVGVWTGPPETTDIDVAARFAAGFVLAERQVRNQVATRRSNRRKNDNSADGGRRGGGAGGGGGGARGGRRGAARRKAARARLAGEQLVARVQERASRRPATLSVQRSAASVIE